MTGKVEAIERYFRLVESFSTEAAAFDALWHPDFLQTEFPNAMSPQVRTRNRPQCLEGVRLGKTLLSEQLLRMQHVVESGDQVVVEATWSGTIAKDTGTLRSGQVLKAYLCMVFEFRDGRIYRQKNYDCYEAPVPAAG